MRNRSYGLMVLWSFIPFLLLAQESEEVRRYQEKIEKSRTELEKLQNQIKESQKKKEEKERQEKSVGANLKELETRLKNTEKEKQKVGEDLSSTQQQIQEIRKKLAHLNKKSEESYSLYADSLRVLYERRESDRTGFLFFPEDFVPAYYTQYVLKQVVQRETGEIKQLKTEKDKSQNLKVVSEKKEKDLKKLHHDIQNKEQKLQVQKQGQDNLLEKVKQEKSAYEKEVARLKQESEFLHNLVAELAEKKTKAEKEYLAQLRLKEKGHLSWPVPGQVVGYFGKQFHPEFNSYLVNNGISIKASSPEVKSVAEGRVLFAESFKGYKQTVIIDHGGELCSVYSQLGEIKIKSGATVKEGDLIGLAGEEPLYFEVRSKNKAENPLAWLRPR